LPYIVALSLVLTRQWDLQLQRYEGTRTPHVQFPMAQPLPIYAGIRKLHP
jgi:hypothetical protein